LRRLDRSKPIIQRLLTNQMIFSLLCSLVVIKKWQAT
jgi:hypothetical protein